MSRTAVDDFVFGIEGERGIGYGERLKSCVYEMRGVVDEVFGRHFDGCWRVLEVLVFVFELCGNGGKRRSTEGRNLG